MQSASSTTLGCAASAIGWSVIVADGRVSLRLRLTAAATGVVTLVLAAGALGILVLFHHTLDEGLESNAFATHE